MKKITGFVLAVSSGAGILYSLACSFVLFSEGLNASNEVLVIVILVLIPLCSCGLHYTLTTKFWLVEKNELKDLIRENEIFNKKVEKQELLRKLNSE